MATKKEVEALMQQVSELSEQVALLTAAKQQPAKAKKERGQPRADVYYVLHGVPTHNIAPQAITCARVLSAAANVNHIPESEAMELIEAAKQSKKLRTVQDSWHIFCYYRAKLIAGNFLQMKSLND